MSHAIFMATGLVVATYGRHCLVESSDGSRRICHPRGKKSQVVVGDHVMWSIAPSGQGDEGAIEQVETRRNVLYRQDDIRTKTFAANIDQLLILLAAEPQYSDRQLTRVLIAAEAAKIPSLILLNKRDLAAAFAQSWNRLASYREMGYTVHQAQFVASANAQPNDEAWGVSGLTEYLWGKVTLVLGPSGTGKSTLINRLVPGAAVQTQEISRALHQGKHTTTSTTWYWVGSDRKTAVIDSPGFQEFGLQHIGPRQLAELMPDIRRNSHNCRFHNCSHLHEPGCKVLTALNQSTEGTGISKLRHAIYQELFDELSQPVKY